MKKIPSVLMVLMIVICSVSPIGSSVASAAPVSISTCTALQNITSTGLNGDYVLGGNIDCSGIGNFSPIGTFTGTLDGQGYTISNFTVNRSDQTAMFSFTNGAVIRNLSVTNATVGGGSEVAVLVGHATNTVITNVAVSSGGTLFASSSAGGLVGYADNTIISYSHASVSINNGGWNTGGLVGATANGTIISKSYSNGSIAGSTITAYGGNIGGLVGSNDSSTIVDSYSQGSVGGGIFWVDPVGGLVGVNNGATALINRSYSTGNFNVNGNPQGLVGSQTNGATTTNSYWDTSSSGVGSSAAGVGKNTSEMQTQGTFVSGWDFTNVWIIGGYPTLRAGDVTAPSAPTSLTAVATGANVHIAWTNPNDVDFASVYLRRNTTNSPSTILAGTGLLYASTNNSYDNNGLADGTYYYSVIAVDTNGNYSIPARTSVVVDTTAPSAPTSLTAPVTGSIVTLHWTNPGDADFATITIAKDTTGYPSTVDSGTPVIAGLIGTSYPNTVPVDGTYYYSIFALDNTGNISTAGHITAVVDTVLPVLAVATPIATATSDTTPNFSFTTTEAGTITYGGSCTSGTTSASIGANTVTFNTLANGTYSNCTVTVTDSSLNASAPLSVGTFTIDTISPTLTAGTAVTSPVLASDAIFTFSTSESGTYSLSGCTGGRVNTSAHTVTFTDLSSGTYTCTLSITDAAGNGSNSLTIGPFTIYSPSHSHGVNPIVTPTSNDGSPLGFTKGPITTSTNGFSITIKLNGNPKTVKSYLVSLDPSFNNANIMPYKSSVDVPLPDTSSSQTIYLKYYSTTNTPSNVIAQTLSSTGNNTNSVKDPAILARNLHTGMSGNDVKYLQQFLNIHGFHVSIAGAGSAGKETTYYGTKVKAAVMKYQKAKKIAPANGVTGPLTRATIIQDISIH